MLNIIEELKAVLPPVFQGSRVDILTGGAIHWPTIQNKRALREIPIDCFVYAGRKVLIVRDPFLAWWGATLSTNKLEMLRSPEAQKVSATEASHGHR